MNPRSQFPTVHVQLNLLLVLLAPLLALVFAGNASAQVEMVADINPGRAVHGSNPSALTPVGDYLYFFIEQARGGLALARFDGETTEVVYELVGDFDRTYHKHLYAHEGELFFTANDGVHGYELWKWDGASAEMLADCNPGPESSSPIAMTAMGSELYFIALDGEEQLRLWEYDGKRTRIVSETISLGGTGGMGVFQGEIYFGARDGIHGNELWKYDGMRVSMIADIVPGPESSFPIGFREIDGELYFGASGLTTGRFKYNAATDVLTALPQYDESPTRGAQLVHVGSNAYYSNYDAATGSELWVFDGVDHRMLVDLAPGVAGSEPKSLTPIGDKLFFLASPIDSYRTEIFIVDGDEILDPQESGAPGFDYVIDGRVAKFKDVIYFTGEESSTGSELWKYDGENFSLVEDFGEPTAGIGSEPAFFTIIDGDLYFGANDGVDRDEGYVYDSKELWKYDGSDLTYFPGLNAKPIAKVGDILYFSAASPQSGWALWGFDGESTSLVHSFGAFPYLRGRLGSVLLLTTGNIQQHWRLKDGVVSLIPNSPDRQLVSLGVVNGSLLLITNDEVDGFELWTFDGSTLSKVEGLEHGGGTYPNVVYVDEGVVYFRARENVVYPGPFVYYRYIPGEDPTLETIFDSSQSHRMRFFDKIGDDLWFIEPGETGGATLILYNTLSGETDSVTLLDDAVEYIGGPQMMNDQLYFLASDQAHGQELWKYDGTSAQLVHDIRPGSLGSANSFVVNLGDYLYFQADDGVNGPELWRSDGQSAILMRDIRPGWLGSKPYNITALGSDLYFSADDGVNGEELWVIHTDNPGNAAPIFTTSGDREANEELELSFTITGSDADGDTLAYGLDEVSRAKGVQLLASDGTFRWTPTRTQQGTHSVTLTLSDGIEVTTQTFSIVVNNVDEPSASGACTLNGAGGTSKRALLLLLALTLIVLYRRKLAQGLERGL